MTSRVDPMAAPRSDVPVRPAKRFFSDREARILSDGLLTRNGAFGFCAAIAHEGQYACASPYRQRRYGLLAPYRQRRYGRFSASVPETRRANIVDFNARHTLGFIALKFAPFKVGASPGKTSSRKHSLMRLWSDVAPGRLNRGTKKSDATAERMRRISSRPFSFTGKRNVVLRLERFDHELRDEFRIFDGVG